MNGADGRRLYFTSRRLGGDDLFVASRASHNSPFDEYSPLSNDDGKIDLMDAFANLGFQLLDGPPPSSPVVRCGVDSTSDDLGCRRYENCP